MKSPKIWINVSASHKWNRPAVGILRVEQSLADNLEKLLGGMLGKCIWHDDKFIDLVDFKEITTASTSEITNVHVDPIAQTAENRTVVSGRYNFDIALNIYRLFRGRHQSHQINVDSNSSKYSENQAANPEPAIQPKTCLRRGDVLITVGLDWDYPYTSEFYKLKNKHGIKIISCSYDLIPILFPQYCVGDVAKWFSDYLIRLTWGSSAVLCISKQTQNDYLTFCKNVALPTPRTKVITLGDNVPSSVGDISNEVSSIADKSYILFVSSIERRKNHETLYKAYNLLIEMGYQDILPKLVFVGMHGWGVTDLMKDIELNPLTSGHIMRMNHVNDAELNLLYKNALFCLYPSLYEGWGLPIGEALAMGKLVIASDKGSIPEVGGSFVHYVEVWNPYAWAEAIIDFVKHPEKIILREKQVLAGYKARKWTDTAQTVKELALELLHDSSQQQWEFMPGYDLSTQCGIQLGGKVSTQGLSGYLVYGPHIPFNAGFYEITVEKCNFPGFSGFCLLDIVSCSGTKVHSTFDLDLSSGSSTFQYNLIEDENDIEFRIYVDNQVQMELTKIYVNKKSYGQANDK